MTDYKVSAKRSDGKWWNFGRIKTNQYGNLSLSFKNTPELREHVLQGGEWLNFSLFEDKPKEGQPKQEVLPPFNDSEIPF